MNNALKLYALSFLLICNFFDAATADVVLDGKTVLKDQIIVYIFIGHSNMAGRAPNDQNTHDRCWSYKIDQDNHQWVKAQDVIHHERYNTNCNGATKGGRAMPKRDLHYQRQAKSL